MDKVSDDLVWEAYCAYVDVYDGPGSEMNAMRAVVACVVEQAGITSVEHESVKNP